MTCKIDVKMYACVCNIMHLCIIVFDILIELEKHVNVLQLRNKKDFYNLKLS